MAGGSSIAGTWAYRSYRNTAQQQVFGAGIFTFTTPSATKLKGTLDMGGGLVLDLNGTIKPARRTARSRSISLPTVDPARRPMAGNMIITAISDFSGRMAWTRSPSLVGTILRAKPHNGNPAGVTASFIAVKQS